MPGPYLSALERRICLTTQGLQAAPEHDPVRTMRDAIMYDNGVHHGKLQRRSRNRGSAAGAETQQRSREPLPARLGVTHARSMACARTAYLDIFQVEACIIVKPKTKHCSKVGRSRTQDKSVRT